MIELKNKVAIITGSGQGIGRGIALEMAKAGADIVVADIDSQAAETVVAEIKALGRDAIAVTLDVTDSESVTQGIDQLLKHFPRLDILVNNAGIHKEHVGVASTIEQFDLCLDVNLKGVWRMVTAVVAHFRAHKGGKIINIASINGRVPWADTPGYSASKAAVINLTQSLAMKLAADNINVNAVCPGGVITAMADSFDKSAQEMLEGIIASRALKRALSPEDIGQAVVFFASSSARNITGQSLNVDGGCVMS